MDVRLENAGEGETQNDIYAGFFLSTDTNITLGDIKICNSDVFSSGLRPGSGETQSNKRCMLANDLPTGDYWLGAYADVREEEPEASETNNGAYNMTQLQVR